MLLLVDVGNTNVTIGVARDGQIVTTHRTTTSAGATSDELEFTIESLLRLDGASLDSLSSMVLASVVPSVTDAFKEIAARRGRPLLIASASTVPLPLQVDNPDEVGADRLVNALAAQRLFGQPAIVVDFGTATTLDCVDESGAYIGGSIAPGLEIGLDALAARTAKLPRIELRIPDSAIGRNTVSAIQAGAILGYQELASGLIRRTRAELSGQPDAAADGVKVILTGGLSASPWAKAIKGVTAIDPELTLKGLVILHEEHAGSSTSAGRTSAAAS